VFHHQEGASWLDPLGWLHIWAREVWFPNLGGLTFWWTDYFSPALDWGTQIGGKGKEGLDFLGRNFFFLKGNFLIYFSNGVN